MRLIQALFLTEGDTKPTTLGKDNPLWSLYDIHERILKDIALGVDEFLIFPVPVAKEHDPTWGWIGEAIHNIKDRYAYESTLAVDLCLCSTMPDGHCHHPDPERSRELMINQARAVHRAGADTLAPSDCQPHTVSDIRTQIPEAHIMSYSTKFRSTFYRGYREAMSIEKGIERTYQLDVNDREGAIQRSVDYSNDGADELMVKPGITGIDLIEPIKQRTGKPCGVFQTSGEWLGIGAPGSLQETHDVFQRAGADYMISYGARLL